MIDDDRALRAWETRIKILVFRGGAETPRFSFRAGEIGRLAGNGGNELRQMLTRIPANCAFYRSFYFIAPVPFLILILISLVLLNSSQKWIKIDLSCLRTQSFRRRTAAFTHHLLNPLPLFWDDTSFGHDEDRCSCWKECVNSHVARSSKNKGCYSVGIPLEWHASSFFSFFFFTAIDFSIGDARNVAVHDSLSSLPFLRSSMYLISNTNLKSAL